jgi:hypothetical protein
MEGKEVRHGNRNRQDFDQIADAFSRLLQKQGCPRNRVEQQDPFYDRDLNNFRLLFELRAVSAGVIITRCDELQEIFDGLNRGKSYGSSTTHMQKLLPRIQGGGGGGCPLLVFGISKKLYVED